MPRSGRARLLGRALESGRPDTLETVRATGQGALSEALPFFAARTLPREEVYIRSTYDPILANDGRTDRRHILVGYGGHR